MNAPALDPNAIRDWRDRAPEKLDAYAADLLWQMGAGRFRDKEHWPKTGIAAGPRNRLLKRKLIAPVKKAGKLVGYGTTTEGARYLEVMGPHPLDQRAEAETKAPAPSVIDAPGFYLLASDAYHADPVIAPSLSHSFMHRMLSRSPKHAWNQHPRLNPRYRPRLPTTAMQEGTILHWLILDAGAEPVIIDAPDFRSEAAKSWVAKAAAEGRPITTLRRYRELRRCAAAARRELRQMLDVPTDIDQGFAECTLVWREGREWCRSMVDWLVPRAKAPIVDFKFTGRAAAPEDWAKTAADNGYDIQRSFYRRGFEAVFEKEAGEVYFATIETEEPYGVAVNALGFEAAELGDDKVKRGIQLWQTCRAAGEWPSYPRQAHYTDLPRYAALQWEARDMRQVAAIEEMLRRRHRGNPDVRRLIEEHGFV